MAGLSFVFTTTAANTPTILNVPSNFRGLLVTIDSTTSRNGLYLMHAASNGTVGRVPVVDATGLAFENTANKLSITSAGATRIVVVNVAYKATIAS